MSRILVGGKSISRELRRWAGGQSDFAHYNYEGFRVSNFYGVTEILKSNSPIHQPRRVAFCSKTSISTDRQQRAEFSHISAPATITMYFAFPILRLYSALRSNSTNHHFRRVTFWSKTPIARGHRWWVEFTHVTAH